MGAQHAPEIFKQPHLIGFAEVLIAEQDEFMAIEQLGQPPFEAFGQRPLHFDTDLDAKRLKRPLCPRQRHPISLHLFIETNGIEPFGNRQHQWVYPGVRLV